MHYKEKWTPIIRSFFKEIQPPLGFCKLSSYGSVVRGIATGANEFFGLTKSKIEDRGLKECHICKCITKSLQIRKLVFTDNDFQCLYIADKPVYCLDVRERLDETVRSYIEEGEKSGFHPRYLQGVVNVRTTTAVWLAQAVQKSFRRHPLLSCRLDHLSISWETHLSHEEPHIKPRLWMLWCHYLSCHW